jgi:transposase
VSGAGVSVGASRPLRFRPRRPLRRVTARQHLPRERCAQTLTDLFGVSVSTGTLDNWMREAADALVGFLAVVAGLLAAAPVVHADETSVRSAKGSLWVHVCSTVLLTLLHVGRRDKVTVELGPLGDYTGTIVHDRLAMYFNYGTAHVLCNAHYAASAVMRNVVSVPLSVV